MARIYDVLCADHRDLDRIYGRLLEEVRARDLEAADRTWSEFERELRNHLDAEETFVLPHLDQTAPNDAAHLRAEHDQIRNHLSELGVNLELHLLQGETAHTFITLLQSHANHEETSLYPFAERFLTEEAQKSLLDRIRKNVVDAIMEWQGP